MTIDSSGIVIVAISVAVVGVLLIIVIALTKKAQPQLDVNKYRMKWLAIEKQLSSDNPASCQMAVMNADKLLDQALKDHRTKGETMGARMKAANDLWSNANAIWSAHKVRNRLAHEADTVVGFDEARRTLASFKQALKDVGAI
ncbi:MAG: hypothetical protein ABIR91_03770 [Candidatus Saccharimonadales bacterium]